MQAKSGITEKLKGQKRSQESVRINFVMLRFPGFAFSTLFFMVWLSVDCLILCQLCDLGLKESPSVMSDRIDEQFNW